MPVHPYKLLLAAMLAIAIAPSSRALGGVIDDGPQHLSETSSIGESLRNAGGRPVHILYVHGIAALSAGGSHTFQKAICAYLRDCTAPSKPLSRDYADNGPFAPGAQPVALSYLGKPVWMNPEEWSASSPFVDHYVLQRTDGGPIVLDEINWWPLALSLKCRGIMAAETRQAGPNAPLLNLCSQPPDADPSSPGRFLSYNWITTQEAHDLKVSPAKGALINRWFKNSTLDWGFSDAMIAVGPMHDVIREGMRQLFLKSVRFNANGSNTNQWEEQWETPRGVDQEFIVVSHSLGSYLVFSTLNLGQRGLPINPLPPPETGPMAEDAAAQYILERTSLVYFFANQISLLELANLRGPEPGAAAASAAGPLEAPGSLGQMITKWRSLRDNFTRRKSPPGATLPSKPAQVIAWSDPSDLLSWRLPAIDGLLVTNLYVRNTAWHWIIANPVAAHANYATNKQVLRIMFGPRPKVSRNQAGGL